MAAVADMRTSRYFGGTVTQTYEGGTSDRTKAEILPSWGAGVLRPYKGSAFGGDRCRGVAGASIWVTFSFAGFALFVGGGLGRGRPSCGGCARWFLGRARRAFRGASIVRA